MICFTPKGKTSNESVELSHDFFDLAKEVGRLNSEFHDFDSLFYLLQSHLGIKDHLPLEGLSHCNQAESLYICNWPISSLNATLLSDKKPTGQQKEFVLQTGMSEELCCLLVFTSHHNLLKPCFFFFALVANLYSSVHKALCVGPSTYGKRKWRDEIHPKFWTFLSIGPNGNLKLSALLLLYTCYHLYHNDFSHDKVTI